ncbi:hypothetical protein GOODEAATRI_007881, partial [Goodea atripinnis]
MKIDTNLTPQLPEASSQAGLQFAVATEEDFDEIMAMSQDIYGGLDYLPTRYTSWLQDSNRMVILARKEGKVIALESACVIDDGGTMLVEGLRVAPQERGKGVAGVLLRFCSELVKSKFPDVKVTRLTRDDQLGPKDFEKYRIITKQILTIHNGIMKLYLLITSAYLPKRLMINKHRFIYSVDCSSVSKCILFFRHRYYLNIDMFGKDLNLAQQQFLCHLQHHTTNLKGHVMCQIFLEPGLWKPMVNFCQNTLNVDLVKEYTEQCVVESDLV